MQAHLGFCFAKIVFLPLQIYQMKTCKTFSLLLPSHNCIIIHNVQFSRCISSKSISLIPFLPPAFRCRQKLHIVSIVSPLQIKPASLGFDLVWLTGVSRDSMKFLVSKELQSISLVEISGIEPLTSCLQGRRSPS